MWTLSEEMMCSITYFTRINRWYNNSMNIQNKICKIGTALFLAIGVIGCTPKKESVSTHTVNDGNYTGIGTGYNG